MTEWFIFLRGVAMGLLLAFMLSILLRFRQYYAMRVLALFALSVSGYVLAPLAYGKTQWFYLVGLLADTVPLMFLLFVQALFDEHRAPSVRTLSLGALYIGLGYIGYWFPRVGLVEWADVSLVRMASRVVMTLMLAYGIYRVLRNWQMDLVEQRRRLRVAVSVIVGCYILGVVLVESTYHLVVPDWVELANSAGIVASTLLFMGVAISLGPDGLVLASEGPTQPPQVAADNPVLARITTSMEQDQLYRDMELTIRQLGDRLGIPEHQLRRHINQELGYRNFNDFLNRYRLAEVSQRLVAEDSRQLPILTIAMDAGYRSLTTFNRAFKAAYGVTPREYREKY
jgi:AraC-like DNA-binding protein